MNLDPQTMILLAVIAFMVFLPNSLNGMACKLAAALKPGGGVVPAAGAIPAAGQGEMLQLLGQLFSQHLQQTHLERTSGPALLNDVRNSLRPIVQQEIQAALAKLLTPSPASPAPPSPPASPPA